MGTLYIVATPIGNLEDITLRALKVLKEVDFIICEDTRHTAILLKHFDIKKPLISFHQHSKLQKVEIIISKLVRGENGALVTDAGTPGISDPAGFLIEKGILSNIKIVPIPGPSALTALLSIASWPVEKFVFLGFLPKKKGRKTLLEQIFQSKLPVVLFESPHRIVKTLTEIEGVIGERNVIVARELTKKFEEIYRGKIKNILKKIKSQGEFVVLIGPKEK